jgi:hypothetical protein
MRMMMKTRKMKKTRKLGFRKLALPAKQVKGMWNFHVQTLRIVK